MTSDSIGETKQCRVAVLLPESGKENIFEPKNCWLLNVQIPTMTRVVRQLQRVVQETWGIHVWILDIQRVESDGSTWALAELLDTEVGLNGEAPRAIEDSSEEEKCTCELLLANVSQNPFARIGWVGEALRWLSAVTGRRFSKGSVTQLNAGGGFTLARFCSSDGFFYWLKAAGVPNEHELAITLHLSELCPDFLPKIVAVQPEWKAWVTEDAGEALSLLAEPGILVETMRNFLSLQVKTIGVIDVLLAAGASDQRNPRLLRNLDQVIDFLADAMGRQISTKATPLKRDRILELGRMLFDAFSEMESLGLPNTLLHNDLNAGNILYDGKKCVVTDWSEAAVGNPLLAAERFGLLSTAWASSCGPIYREVWREFVGEESVRRAQRLAPLLSIFAYLYGRGDWLRDSSKITPHFESYARSLARHMDRAAENSDLLEALCH
jgi:hypothetical protein